MARLVDRLRSFCLALLSLVVPGGARRDWLEEWEAEFDHAAARRPGLGPTIGRLGRLAGAARQAWLLRREVSGRWMAGLGQDGRLALRAIRRQPGVSLTIVVTFSLGIGANAAIFAVMRGSILAPLAMPDASRLVLVSETNPTGSRGAFSYPDLQDWRQATTTVEENEALSRGSRIATGVNDADRVQMTSVTPGLFGLVGFDVRGRRFTDLDQQPNAEPVVIVSRAFALREFGERDPVGLTFTLDGVERRIVGTIGTDVLAPLFPPATDVWVPLVLRPQVVTGRGNRNLTVLGRLRPGADASAASREFATFVARLGDAFPRTNAGRSGEVVTLPDELAAGVERGLVLAWLVTAVVLLVACANVAGLLFVRNLDRGREFVVRAALGASRARIARAVLVECLVFACLGGLAALLVLGIGMPAVRSALPDALPRRDAIGIDPLVIAAALAVALGSALVAGLPAAWRASASTAAASAGRHTGDSQGWRRLLVGAQLACAVLLLVVGGLLASSLVRLARVPPGFHAERAITMQLLLPRRVRTVAGAVALIDRMLEAIRSEPDVADAALMGPTPFAKNRNRWDVTVDGLEQPAVLTDRYTVSAGVFRLMGIDLVAGRLLGGPDFALGSARAAVVDETFVDRVLGGRSALGRVVHLEKQDPITVVGVVRHVKHYALDEAPRPQIYVPFVSDPASWINIVVTGRSGVPATMTAARRAILSVAPDAPPYAMASLRSLVDDSLADRRVAATLAGALAVLALAVAVSGLYGSMRFLVERRTREIGVRAALGATRRSLFALVFGEAARVVFPGLVVGLAGGALGVRVVRSLLFDTTPFDPFTWAIVIAALTTAAALAVWGPARRAASVDPAVTLRA